jgi:hypothetical protein
VLAVTLVTDAATRFVAELFRAGPNPWQLWVFCTLLASAGVLVLLWLRRARTIPSNALPHEQAQPR